MTVIIYSKNGCTACEQAKLWFAERGIPFLVRNADDSTMGKTYVKELLMMDLPEDWGYPVIVWAGAVISGYRPKKLAEMAERMGGD